MPCTPSSLLLAAVLLVTGGVLARAGDGGPLTVLGVVLAVVGILIAVLDALIPDPQATLAKLRAKQAQLLTGSPTGPAAADTHTVSNAQPASGAASTTSAGAPRNRAERRAAARRR